MNTKEKIVLTWGCQACGRDVIESFTDEVAVRSRAGALDESRTCLTRICPECTRTGRLVPACERCGACCAYGFVIHAPVDGIFIKAGHVCDFDGIEGEMRKQIKPWSGARHVCVLLRHGEGCIVHDCDMQPVDCQEFNCHLPPFAEEERFADFREFRSRWIADGIDRCARGDG
jgi:hypothetical protein